jgi:hypothetical protein
MTNGTLQAEVTARLIETLAGLQSMAGREFRHISDDTVPFDDLPGFDSVNGVEAAVMFSELVSVEVDSLAFVSHRSGHHLSIRETVETVIATYGDRIAASLSKDGSSADPLVRGANGAV